MWYLLLGLAFAAWVFLDAQKRKAEAVLWALGTLIFGPVVLPIYLAKRPLKAGEIREGGLWWNVLKNFAIFWTILMAFAGVWGLVAASQQASPLQSNAEMAGAAIGTALGLGMIATLWFFPFVGAVVLGLLLRKSSVVERGPTSPLAASMPQAVSGDPSVEPAKSGQTAVGGQSASDRVFVWSDATATAETKRSSLVPIVLAIVGIVALAAIVSNSLNRRQQSGTGSASSGGTPALEVVNFEWGSGQYGTTVLVGTVRNNTGKTYSYVQVEFNLYDESGAQVGSTFANVNNLEPGGTWRFEAVVLEHRASKARLKGVTGF